MRLFMVRLSRAPWIDTAFNSSLHLAAEKLLDHELHNLRTQEEFRFAARGAHFACILGHHRQSAKVSYTHVTFSVCER